MKQKINNIDRPENSGLHELTPHEIASVSGGEISGGSGIDETGEGTGNSLEGSAGTGIYASEEGTGLV